MDDNNGGAFGPVHKVYDIWLDDFEKRGKQISSEDHFQLAAFVNIQYAFKF